MSRFVHVWPKLVAAALITVAVVHPRPVRRAASLSVTAVRFTTLPDVTRIAIEVSGQFRFLSDRVPNPDRIYFDIPSAHSKLAPKGEQVIPVNDNRVRQIRVAQTQLAVTRIVLDLETSVEISASRLANPDRLIVEVRSRIAAPRLDPPVTPAPLAPPARIAVPQARRKFVAPEPQPRPAGALEPIPAPPQVAVILPSSERALPALRTPPPPRRPRTRAIVPAATESIERVAKAPARTQANEGSAATAATRNSDGERSMTRVLGLKIGRIVIDAGHGGHDQGTAGRGGLLEKDLVLDVAKRLGRLVADRMGSEVIYTRSDDTFIPLEKRTQIANDRRADLFLSIHANSSPIRTTAGVETFYLNFSTSTADLDVAARENASSQKTVYELKDLLQKIALQDKVEESRELAAKVQTSLYTFSARNNARLRNRGVKKAPFVVLIGAQMPSILAEIGFISNPREEALMAKPEHRQKMAEALYRGLAQYAGTLSHFQIARQNPAE